MIGSPVELAQRVQEWALGKGVNIAFTQWIVAWQRHRYTEPFVTSAYVSRLPGAVDLG